MVILISSLVLPIREAKTIQSRCSPEMLPDRPHLLVVIGEMSPVPLVPIISVGRARHLTALFLPVHLFGARLASVSRPDQDISLPLSKYRCVYVIVE